MPLCRYRDTYPQVGARALIHDSAQVLGDVTLGEDCSVWCGAVLRGDIHRIVVGRGTNIQDLCIGHVTHAGFGGSAGSPLTIGEYVTVGHGAILHGCTVGDRCLIGMGSLVLDDTVLEPEVMLGAGSLVASGKRLERGHLYFGRPAAKVRPLTDDERALLFHSAEIYIRLKDEYLNGSPP